MKVYTKTGDKGETSLLGGTRVPKSDGRIDLYGDVDALNSLLGTAISFLSEKSKSVENTLVTIQNILFDIGSIFACPVDKRQEYKLYEIQKADIDLLENSIDEMEKSLEPLKNFILPGGHSAACFIHQGRTTCRALERKLVQFRLENPEEFSEIYINYFNRLSDYFFVLTRYINHLENIKETKWEARTV